MRRIHGFCVLVIVISAGASVNARADTLTRQADPVVLTGADLPSLSGLAVDQIVAFRYDGGWQQIPVQIDERKVVDFGDVYNGLYGVGVTTPAYADPNTYCGPDTDPAFDGDDELVFMAKDAGDQPAPGAGEPSGVIAGTGVALTLSDSLDTGVGYIYLFRTDGSLVPDAGQDYVTYTFDLLAGEYIPDYDLADGPNPEDSEAYTDHYRTHFSDRWIRDEVNVYAGGATGVDILDRHKNLFVIGSCSRTENSFSNGEGAFFVNKDGPVRALRSYMGANSGPLTQRIHHFYEQRQDITTHLRVHGIPGVMDLYDYTPAATGMTYYSNADTSGATIDGVPDSVTLGGVSWEMVTGAQGSLLISHHITTDASLSVFTYYSDDSTPSATQCTGDAYEYGLSGLWVPQPIPNTDPIYPPFYVMAVQRILHYEAPGQTVSTAQLRHDQTATPLGVSVGSYQPTAALTLTIFNDIWGSVDFDPEPDDANAPVYAVGTPVTLTAEPTEGRGFNRWLIFDADYPGDANHAVQDTNAVLTLTLAGNTDVDASFKCASGVEPFIGMVLMALAAAVVRRRP